MAALWVEVGCDNWRGCAGRAGTIKNIVNCNTGGLSKSCAPLVSAVDIEYFYTKYLYMKYCNIEYPNIQYCEIEYLNILYRDIS